VADEHNTRGNEMTKLAECEGKWLLVKVKSSGGGWEYWYILPNLETGCLNTQESDYNALNALAYLERWGKATWTRSTIKSC